MTVSVNNVAGHHAWVGARRARGRDVGKRNTLHRLVVANPGDSFSDRVTWIEPPSDGFDAERPSS
jgi:hypothetical protein